MPLFLNDREAIQALDRLAKSDDPEERLRFVMLAAKVREMAVNGWGGVEVSEFFLEPSLPPTFGALYEPVEYLPSSFSTGFEASVVPDVRFEVDEPTAAMRRIYGEAMAPFWLDRSDHFMQRLFGTVPAERYGVMQAMFGKGD